jgi:hypothetical protein
MIRINITIPDNLSPTEELLAIAKQLGKKMLPTGQKELGTGYVIKHSETQIVIKREAVEKPIVTRECRICKSIVEQSIAKVLYTNYGGNKKKHYYCSEDCRDVVMNITGQGRASTKRSGVFTVEKI